MSVPCRRGSTFATRHLRTKLRRAAKRRLRLSDEGEDGVARSARTRQWRGDAPRGIGRASCDHGSHGIKRCDRGVSHKKSPAGRGRSRQDASFTCDPKRLTTPDDDKSFSVVVRCGFDCAELPAQRSASLLLSRFLPPSPRAHFLSKPCGKAREISTQNNRSHLAMGCNTHKTRKASLTCKPSLICWSALVRWSL
jgi:hypothetical protein